MKSGGYLLFSVECLMVFIINNFCIKKHNSLNFMQISCQKFIGIDYFSNLAAIQGELLKKGQKRCISQKAL